MSCRPTASPTGKLRTRSRRNLASRPLTVTKPGPKTANCLRQASQRYRRREPMPTLCRKYHANQNVSQALREVIALIRVMVDVYCPSYAMPPKAVTLEIDDAVDVVHGHRQLSLFNACYEERCFLPTHVYGTATSHPVAMLLRPGKTPSGPEVARHLRRPIRTIRRRWPATRITTRGDGHYGRPEVMAWCETNCVDYLFGLPCHALLRGLVEPTADDLRVHLAESELPMLCRYAETRYGAKTCGLTRRVAARIEASVLGLDIRFIGTSLPTDSAEESYDTLCYERGQAENFITAPESTRV